LSWRDQHHGGDIQGGPRDNRSREPKQLLMTSLTSAKPCLDLDPIGRHRPCLEKKTLSSMQTIATSSAAMTLLAAMAAASINQ
jgi:hypothetical protein